MLACTLATFGYPLPPLALALRLPLALVAGGALVAGVGSAFGGAIGTTVVQRHVPAAALSRVGSFGTVGAFAFGPVAFVAAGPAASAVGTRALLGFGAAWAVLGTVVVLCVPSVRRLTWAPPAGDERADAVAGQRGQARFGGAKPAGARDRDGNGGRHC